MSEKKSKVVEVIGTGPIKSTMPDGNVLWKQDIVLENGDKGTLYSKTNIIPAASVGNILIYTISSAKAIKIVKVNPEPDPTEQQTSTPNSAQNTNYGTKTSVPAVSNPIASAYSQAKDVAVALIEKGTAKDATVENAKKYISEIANFIFDEMAKTKARHDKEIEKMNDILNSVS